MTELFIATLHPLHAKSSMVTTADVFDAPKLVPMIVKEPPSVLIDDVFVMVGGAYAHVIVSLCCTWHEGLVRTTVAVWPMPVPAGTTQERAVTLPCAEAATDTLPHVALPSSRMVKLAVGKLVP